MVNTFLKYLSISEAIFMIDLDNFLSNKRIMKYTAIPYRVSTGPEQGFPCEVFHTGRNLFSIQGTPVLIAGTPVFITGNGFAVDR